MTSIPRAANSDELVQGVYKHYKNKQLYQVYGCVLHSETREKMVLYSALHYNKRNPENFAFVRPHVMFIENVEHNGQVVPRFEFIRKSD